MTADPSRTLTLLTRLGFAARGLLYIVIGFLVLRTGRTEDPAGALSVVAEGGGRTLLYLIIAGFLAYGLWRLSDAAFNIERHEPGKKGLAERAGAAASGIVHLILAWQAVRIVQSAGAGSGGGGTQEGAQTALQLPGGQLMLVVAGLVLLGSACCSSRRRGRRSSSSISSQASRASLGHAGPGRAAMLRAGWCS
jgi:hypothetical protein